MINGFMIKGQQLSALADQLIDYLGADLSRSH